MPMGFIAALNFGHDLQNLRLRKFLREQANGHSENNLYSFAYIKTRVKELESCTLDFWDQYLSNCAPAPPLTQ